MKKILFIGHDANRTGAPIVLLHFLRWFAARNPEVEADLLLLKGGELVEEYRSVSRVFVMPDRRSRPLARRILHRLKRNMTGSDAIIEKGSEPFGSRYDVVVGNTIATLDHVAWFGIKGARAVNWVHELEGVIRIYFTPKRLRSVSASTDRFVAASRAVEVTLRDLGVSGPVDVVYEFSVLEHLEAEGDARRELKIPHDAFVVGGCGSIEPRKGVDLFVKTLQRVRCRNEDAYFVWIGGPGPGTNQEFKRVRELAERLGVQDRLVFTGITDRPDRYFKMIDLFALTSREDPFPLVCLEAASVAKPIICFDGAGGMPEFVEQDAGAVVPLGDIDRFAVEILRFKDDIGLLRAAGQRAREKFENEFSIERSCRRLENLIFEVCKEER